jgi:hypothetical protein
LELKVLKKSVASPTISVPDKKSSLPISKVKLQNYKGQISLCLK